MHKGVFTIVEKGNLSKAVEILTHQKSTANTISNLTIKFICESLDKGSYLLIEQTNQSYDGMRTYWDLFDEDKADELYNYPESYSIEVSPDEFIEALNELLEV